MRAAAIDSNLALQEVWVFKERIVKILRSQEQVESLGALKLHEVMHEAHVNPVLYMPTDTSEENNGLPDIAYINEVNAIHESGQFDSIAEESSAEYQFYLKLDGSENVVELYFKHDVIQITKETDAELDALVDAADSPNATLVDEAGNTVNRSKPKVMSFWQRLGIVNRTD